MDNKLEFADNSVKIIFNTGGESFYFDSKEEALKAVKDCHEKGKISGKEFNKFVEEISSSDLPSFIEGLAKLTLMIIGTFIGTLIDEAVSSNSSFSITNPRFEFCDCGKMPKHGYFYNDENEPFSMEISSKEQAYMFINNLEQREVITEGDASSLRVFVEMQNDFLEDPLMN